jgi:hypothetical protein
MISHNSTTTTRHRIELTGDDIFVRDGVMIRWIDIISVDGILTPDCKIANSVADFGLDSSIPGWWGRLCVVVPWKADRDADVIRALISVGLLDEGNPTAAKAEQS